MRRGSLRLRLLVAGAMSLAAALLLAALGLQVLFEHHVERRIASELESHLRQLVGAVEADPDKGLRLARALADPRFGEPLSGLYWQVEGQGGQKALLRSRSLWDERLTLPRDDLADGEVHLHTIAGPGGARLFAAERVLSLPADPGIPFRAVVAVDRAEIRAAGRAFAFDLAPYLAVLGVALVGAGWVQITVGLRPLDVVRGRIAGVRAGRSRSLGSDFPDEILPLAAEVDLLLEAQDQAIARARARAADLAHALRTPLTVLKGQAENLASRGETTLAGEIASIAEAMRLSVDRELARARTAAPAGVGDATRIAPVVEQVVAVLSRLPAAATLDIETDVPGDLVGAADRQDLTEMIGNLGENAVRWARSHIVLRARAVGDALSLTVDDDGPGIPDADLGHVLRRGGRLPQAHEGSGLGLAIVQDLAKAYGGRLTLGASDLGGLRAEIRLPLGRPAPLSGPAYDLSRAAAPTAQDLDS